MKVIGSNIKHLRKQKGWTQEALAGKLGLTRAVIGSYEENRAVPKINVLQQIATLFGLSLDNLVTKKLWETGTSETFADIRILTTTVDSENREQIVVVPAEASAGYTAGYADPEFIEKLPVFHLPVPELSRERTYRLFQIKGDSMEPIKSGSYIICEYLLNTEGIVEGTPHILLTRDDGIVFKRIYKHREQRLMLKSDNPEYEPYQLEMNEVLEIWKALGYMSFELPEKDEVTVSKLHGMMMGMKQELDRLKKNR